MKITISKSQWEEMGKFAGKKKNPDQKELDFTEQLELDLKNKEEKKTKKNPNPKGNPNFQQEKKPLSTEKPLPKLEAKIENSLNKIAQTANFQDITSRIPNLKVEYSNNVPNIGTVIRISSGATDYVDVTVDGNVVNQGSAKGFYEKAAQTVANTMNVQQQALDAKNLSMTQPKPV